MTKEIFGQQISRLKIHFNSEYSKEFIDLLWNAVSKTMDDVWVESVDNLIGNFRYKPLLKDFISVIEEVNALKKQRLREYSNLYNNRIYDVLGTISNKTSANKEFVQKCLELLRDRLNEKLTQTQFIEGCEYLDTLAQLYNPTKSI